MPVEMKVKGLMIDPVSQMPIIVLKKPDDETVLPIWVGLFEANAIAMQLENIVSPRPMTHDLICSVIDALRATVDRVEITDLRDNTFFALIHLDRAGEKLAIDARPSDAMALALRVRVPIFVAESVLQKSIQGDEEKGDETERLRRWLEQVDPEDLGKPM
ncbi:MAG TPA: bifunctional nuclease family protein [Candidatus Polarisedimenticolaceae bacterium]